VVLSVAPLRRPGGVSPSRTAWTALLLWAPVVACDEGGAASNATVTDSAGVVIIASTQPAWGAATAWRIADEPELAIGEPARSGAEEFSRVRRVHSLDDGSIVVVNAGRPFGIRLFDVAGNHLRTIGGEGGGPGEFRAIWDSWIAGADTIVVFDPGLSRMTYFNPAGDVLESVPFEQGASNVAWIPWARFADGLFLMRRNRFIENVEGGGFGRSVAPAVRGTAGGEIIDTIGIFAESDYHVRGSGGPGLVRFGRRAVLHVNGMSYFRGMGDTFAVDEYDATGRHVRSIRRAFEPRAVTEDLTERLMAHDVEAAPPGREEAIRQGWTDQPVAETLPAFGEAWIVDAGGNLWVQQYATAVDPQASWTVFAREGHWLGDVAFPDGFTPHEIGEADALGVFRDSLDVETVRRYALLKGT
jgi:hypothetical protein